MTDTKVYCNDFLFLFFEIYTGFEYRKEKLMKPLWTFISSCFLRVLYFKVVLLSVMIPD